MTQAKIRETILDIVRGEMAYADPMSKVCLDRHEQHPDKFPLGATMMSAEETLEDIILSLTSLQNELRIESSFQSAQL